MRSLNEKLEHDEKLYVNGDHMVRYIDGYNYDLLAEKYYDNTMNLIDYCIGDDEVLIEDWIIIILDNVIKTLEFKLKAKYVLENDIESIINVDDNLEKIFRDLLKDKLIKKNREYILSLKDLKEFINRNIDEFDNTFNEYLINNKSDYLLNMNQYNAFVINLFLLKELYKTCYDSLETFKNNTNI